MSFAHLHLHSEMSLLDGINRLDSLPEHIKSMGQTACALTDHGNISGSYKFFKSCNKAGVKPLLGMEAYYTTADASVRELDDLGEKYYHLVLLAKNGNGLRNLRWLSTKAYTEGMYSKPRIDDKMLAEYSSDLIATSACLGSRISQLILRGKKTEAEKLLLHHADIFKDNFFIEVQLHAESDQQIVNKVLLDIARRRRLPLILTNDCHYTHPQDKLTHEQALCMQTGGLMSDESRFSFGGIDVHVAHHDWMWKQAQAQGIPYEAISNTLAVADMIDSNTYFADIKNRFPRFQDTPSSRTTWRHLEIEAKTRLIKKMGGMPTQEYKDRMDHELKIIKKMGFYDYLLIVDQLLAGARSEDVYIGPGRGSAVGSLVSYALDISQVDPVEHGLVFERWLNYGRSGKPIFFDQEMIEQVQAMKAQKSPCHTGS